jgi:hypothetical protein
MNATIYERLKQTAKERKLTTYSELAAASGVRLSDPAEMNRLGAMLDEIADHELTAGRPLLPVLIVREDTNMPGFGLFRYAKRKGLMKGKSDVEFFAAELKRVYEVWAEQ